MSQEGDLRCLEEQIESTLLAKCSDPAFKLFGRTIPVLSSSESTEKSYESNDSCEVEKIIQKISSSDDEKSSFPVEVFVMQKIGSDDEKSRACVQKSSKEKSSSVEEKSIIGAERKSQEKKLNDGGENNFQRKNLHDEKSNVVGEVFSQKNKDEKPTAGGEKYFQEKKLSDEKSYNGEEKNFQKRNLKDEKANIGGGKKNQKRIFNDEKPSLGTETNGVTDGFEEISGNGEEVPKKPNKLLPCPRCESMDTKFCYYNNYNVNQPRHFCRNCQRYWTAGGLLRNVPVGAGRRKSKNSAMSHQRNFVADSRLLMGHGQDCPSGNSEESIKIEVSDLEMTGFGQVFHDVKSGGKGMGACAGLESCALPSQDNEGYQKPSCSSNQNGSEKGEIFRKPSCSSDQISHDKGGESGEFHPLNVSVSASSVGNSKFIKSEVKESCESNKSQADTGGGYELPNKADSMSWANGSSPIWPLYYSRNVYGNAPYMNGIGGPVLSPESVQTNAIPWFQPGPGPCPGFPWPFPSGPMWGQANWVPAWGMPLSPVAPMSANSDSCPSILGKHTREAVTQQSDCKRDGLLWVPKTLRIDDPGEAAKSSIWATLGLGSKPGSITSGGIFKAFQPKMHNTDNSKTSVQVLCANPAASTRSASFNESS